MNSQPQTCEVCGARLPANAPGGPCPACLIRSAIGQPTRVASPESQDEFKKGAGTGPSPPLKSDSSPMNPGEPTTSNAVPSEQGPGTMIGRYKLLEKVGEGG